MSSEEEPQPLTSTSNRPKIWRSLTKEEFEQQPSFSTSNPPNKWRSVTKMVFEPQPSTSTAIPPNKWRPVSYEVFEPQLSTSTANPTKIWRYVTNEGFRPHPSTSTVNPSNKWRSASCEDFEPQPSTSTANLPNKWRSASCEDFEPQPSTSTANPPNKWRSASCENFVPEPSTATGNPPNKWRCVRSYEDFEEIWEYEFSEESKESEEEFLPQPSEENSEDKCVSVTKEEFELQPSISTENPANIWQTWSKTCFDYVTQLAISKTTPPVEVTGELQTKYRPVPKQKKMKIPKLALSEIEEQYQKNGLKAERMEKREAKRNERLSNPERIVIRRPRPKPSLGTFLPFNYTGEVDRETLEIDRITVKPKRRKNPFFDHVDGSFSTSSVIDHRNQRKVGGPLMDQGVVATKLQGIHRPITCGPKLEAAAQLRRRNSEKIFQQHYKTHSVIKK